MANALELRLFCTNPSNYEKHKQGVTNSHKIGVFSQTNQSVIILKLKIQFQYTVYALLKA